MRRRSDLSGIQRRLRGHKMSYTSQPGRRVRKEESTWPNIAAYDESTVDWDRLKRIAVRVARETKHPL